MTQTEHKEGGASCPMDFILRMLMGPWTTYIIYNLKTFGPQRFGELKRRVGGISAKMLTERLRTLEGAGLVSARLRGDDPAQGHLCAHQARARARRGAGQARRDRHPLGGRGQEAARAEALGIESGGIVGTAVGLYFLVTPQNTVTGGRHRMDSTTLSRVRRYADTTRRAAHA